MNYWTDVFPLSGARFKCGNRVSKQIAALFALKGLRKSTKRDLRSFMGGIEREGRALITSLLFVCAVSLLV